MQRAACGNSYAQLRTCSCRRLRHDGVTNDDSTLAQLIDARSDRQDAKILGGAAFHEILGEQVAVDAYKYVGGPEAGCLKEDVVVRVTTS